MIRRILVGLGAPGFVPAETQTAIQLAERYRAELTGIVLEDLDRIDFVGPVPMGAAESARLLRNRRHEEVREQAEQARAYFDSTCRAAGVRFHVAAVDSQGGMESLIQHARYHDLTVCGLRGIFQTGPQADAPGYAAERLAQLVSGGVRPIIAVAQQPRDVRRVLIAYSGSMESAKTMKQFVQFHPWLGVTLRIVVFGHTDAIASQLLSEAEIYCRAHGLLPELLHVPGSPREQILPVAADWNADLIVLGNSARNLLLRKVLGETALHVMQCADRPLFLSQ